jgi:hypothetical protein
MLGCVARIYQAHLEGDGGLNATDRKFFMNYAEGSHGRGFVSAVEEWFPELSETTLRSAMNEALRMNLTCAQRELEACLVLFQSSCGCSSCGQGGRLQSHGCYLAIAATLIDLISMLSAVVIKHEEMIWPTFAGLRYFFAINSAKMHERDTSTSDRCHRILYKRRAKEMYDHDDITKRLEFIVEGGPSSVHRHGSRVSELERIRINPTDENCHKFRGNMCLRRGHSRAQYTTRDHAVHADYPRTYSQVQSQQGLDCSRV